MNKIKIFWDLLTKECKRFKSDVRELFREEDFYREKYEEPEKERKMLEKLADKLKKEHKDGNKD
jgi:hypothetical protein